jgi:hypothetical protein
MHSCVITIDSERRTDVLMTSIILYVYGLCSYVLEVFILGRYINDGIRTFMVSKHNNPIFMPGTSRGDGSEEYLQPAAVAIDHYKNLVRTYYFVRFPVIKSRGFLSAAS